MKLRAAFPLGALALVLVCFGSLLVAFGLLVRIAVHELVDVVLDRSVAGVAPVVAERSAQRQADLRTRAARWAGPATAPAATFWMAIDAEGRLAGASPSAPRTLDPSALRDAPGGLLAELEGAVYELHRQELVRDGRAAGTLIAGYQIGDADARWLAPLVGDRPVLLRLGDRSIAASGLDATAQAGLAKARTREVRAGDILWRVGYAPLAEGSPIEVLVVADLVALMGTSLPLGSLFAGFGAAVVLFALALAVPLGLALSRPIERLDALTRRIAAGDLTARAEVRGVRELRGLAASMNRMVEQVAASRENLVIKERLERELAIAARVQTSMLPGSLDLPRLDVAAHMQPATEVGGDYYDVLSVPGATWIGIGDVSGHGLDAGLRALMAQTVIAMAIRELPDGTPRELVAAVNRILVTSTWGRFAEQRHMTLTLARCDDDGRVVFAGSHLDPVVVRADGAVEIVPTSGTWIGLVEDIASLTSDQEIRLRDGDTLILYSDGVTEAADARGEQFGMERLAEVAAGAAHRGAVSTIDAILDAVARHRVRQDDDVTVFALRYRS